MENIQTSGRECSFHETLGIEFLPSSSADEALARLKVTKGLCQPLGFLHGGVLLALAETLAGCGSLAQCREDEFPFGVQLSANHVQAAPLGALLTATARALKLGRRLHVWHVEITDENGRLISTSRVVNYIKKKV